MHARVLLSVLLLGACGAPPAPTPAPGAAPPMASIINAAAARRDGPAPSDAVVTYAVFCPGVAPSLSVATRKVHTAGDAALRVAVAPVDDDLPLNLKAFTSGSHKAAVQGADYVVFVSFIGPPEGEAAHITRAAHGAAALAQRADCVVFDLATHQGWAGPSLAQATRAPEWLTEQVLLLGERRDQDVLFFTQGMAKFGRPDLEYGPVAQKTARAAFERFQAAYRALHALGHRKVGDPLDGAPLKACLRSTTHYDHECVRR